MTHHLHRTNPEARKLREAFWDARSDEAKQIDEQAYVKSVREFGETRPFAKWAEFSRKDALIMGNLYPEIESEDWSRENTPEQDYILNQYRNLLGLQKKFIERNR